MGSLSCTLKQVGNGDATKIATVGRRFGDAVYRLGGVVCGCGGDAVGLVVFGGGKGYFYTGYYTVFGSGRSTLAQYGWRLTFTFFSGGAGTVRPYFTTICRF